MLQNQRDHQTMLYTEVINMCTHNILPSRQIFETVHITLFLAAIIATIAYAMAGADLVGGGGGGSTLLFEPRFVSLFSCKMF